MTTLDERIFLKIKQDEKIDRFNKKQINIFPPHQKSGEIIKNMFFV